VFAAIPPPATRPSRAGAVLPLRPALQEIADCEDRDEDEDAKGEEAQHRTRAHERPQPETHAAT
jgi:hypothetical protein